MGHKRYPRSTVFCGHGIADPQAASSWSAERHTRVAPATLDAILARLGERCHLTFDDGYRDNLTAALPILERYGRTATVFVTSGFIDNDIAPMEAVVEAVIDSGAWQNEIDGDTPFDDPGVYQRRALERLSQLSIAARRTEQARLLAASGQTTAALTARYLDRDELGQLAAHPLIRIGAHTHSHPDLRRIDDADLRDELTLSRRSLEDWLGRAVTALAYPYGLADGRVQRAAGRAGYRQAYAMADRHGIRGWTFGRRYRLPRVDLRSVASRLAHRSIRHGAEAAVL